MLFGLLLFCAVVSAISAALVLGGLIADYILPHCKRLDRWVNSLPMAQNDEKEDMR